MDIRAVARVAQSPPAQRPGGRRMHHRHQGRMIERIQSFQNLFARKGKGRVFVRSKSSSERAAAGKRFWRRCLPTGSNDEGPSGERRADSRRAREAVCWTCNNDTTPTEVLSCPHDHDHDHGDCRGSDRRARFADLRRGCRAT